MRSCFKSPNPGGKGRESTRQPKSSFPITWQQCAVALCVLLLAVPSATILYVHLVPMAKDTVKSEFRSEATAIALRMNQTIQSVLVANVIRNHIDDVLACRIASGGDTMNLYDAFHKAAAPFLRAPDLGPLDSIGYIQFVRGESERKKWEAFGQSLYGPSFYFKQWTPDHRIVPSPENASLYLPYIYFAPEKEFSGLMGLDNTFEPARYQVGLDVLNYMQSTGNPYWSAVPAVPGGSNSTSSTVATNSTSPNSQIGATSTNQNNDAASGRRYLDSRRYSTAANQASGTGRNGAKSANEAGDLASGGNATPRAADSLTSSTVDEPIATPENGLPSNGHVTTPAPYPPMPDIITSAPIHLRRVNSYGIGLVSIMKHTPAVVATSLNFDQLVASVVQYRTGLGGNMEKAQTAPINLVLSLKSTGEVVGKHVEYEEGDDDASASNPDRKLVVDLPLADKTLLLTITRPHYSVSAVVVGVYVVLLLTALAVALLLVWQMKLARRVQQHHAQALEEATKRVAAEEASKMKNGFLSQMSHELRTPLNGMVGCCDLISQTPLDAEQLDYVQTMRACSDMLLKVISDILDFSKIEAGRMVLETREFSLSQVLHDVFLVARFKAQETDLILDMEIDKDVEDRVVGDPLRLQQIITNYIGNAVKFTPPGGRVSVFVDYPREDTVIPVSCVPTTEPDPGRKQSKAPRMVDIELPSERVFDAQVIDSSSTAGLNPSGSFDITSDDTPKRLVRFRVRDTGVGIAPDRLARLFTPFVQSDNSITRLFGGTGLGLSICRSLARLMGGDAWAESELGRGSSFFFTVALAVAPRLPEQAVEVDCGTISTPPRRVLEFNPARSSLPGHKVYDVNARDHGSPPYHAESSTGRENYNHIRLGADDASPPEIFAMADRSLGAGCASSSPLDRHFRLGAVTAKGWATDDAIGACASQPIEMWSPVEDTGARPQDKMKGSTLVPSGLDCVPSCGRPETISENPLAEKGLAAEPTSQSESNKSLDSSNQKSVSQQSPDIPLHSASTISEQRESGAEFGVRGTPKSEEMRQRFHQFQQNPEKDVSGCPSWSSESSRPQSPTLTVTNRSLRVLVAEDNAVNMKVATAVLRKLGGHVTQAWNGAEAIDLCAKERFDLILMDLQMPVCDGLSAARAIRADASGANRETPMLALTANVSEDDRRAVQGAGMNDILPKPCPRDKMIGALIQWVPGMVLQ